MKIVIDDKIPYIRGAFEKVADTVYLPGSKTTPEVVKDADAIITRTRTICNEHLLKDSTVRFIATATIGYDHIDTDHCEKNGIGWTNAPGCNSHSVEQYIASVLMVLAERGMNLQDSCLAVVGAGNVGSKVERLARLLGMKVLVNDPPRARAEGSEGFVELQQVMDEADIISLHVPLNMTGVDATFHMADADFFRQLKRKPVLINSCRGEVTETIAVKEALKTGQISDFICDCWENEPDIDLELLSMTALATPHIAGYSKDGKSTGTRMSVEAVSQFLGLDLKGWEPQGVEQPEKALIEIDARSMSEMEILSVAILHTYDIRKDDQLFRADPACFEQLRGDYPVRREFPAYSIRGLQQSAPVTEKLRTMGFKIV